MTARKSRLNNLVWVNALSMLFKNHKHEVWLHSDAFSKRSVATASKTALQTRRGRGACIVAEEAGFFFSDVCR